MVFSIDRVHILFRKRLEQPSICEHVFLSHKFSLSANGCNSHLSEFTLRLRLSRQAYEEYMVAAALGGSTDMHA